MAEDIYSRQPVRENGDYDVSTNVDPSSAAVIAHDRAATPDKTNQNVRVTGVANGNIHAMDVAVHQSDGSDISLANPLPVTVTDAAGGTDVYDPQSSANVAPAATVNHDTLAAGATGLMVKSVDIGSAVKVGVVYQVETGVGTGIFTPMFWKNNSVASPADADLQLKGSILVPTGVNFRVSITNNDVDSSDLHSTVYGVQV